MAWETWTIVAVSLAGAAVLALGALLARTVAGGNAAVDKEVTEAIKAQAHRHRQAKSPPQYDRPLLNGHYPSPASQPPPPPPPPPTYDEQRGAVYHSAQPSFSQPAEARHYDFEVPPDAGRSASPTGLARDENWSGGLHLQLICVKRHPDNPHGSIIPAVVGMKAKAVDKDDQVIGREVAWPCVETVPPSASYVWDTTRYFQAGVQETAAIRFALVLPNNDGLHVYATGCALQEDLLKEYPWEFDVQATDGLWYVVSVGLLSSPDLKKRVILWKCPTDLPHEPQSLLEEEVNVLSDVYQTLQDKLPITGLCQGRTIFAGASVACVQLAMCYLAPLLRWGVEGFSNKATVTRYAHQSQSRFGMNAEEFIRNLKSSTDASFDGIPGVREYLADEGCLLDTMSLLCQSPNLEVDPNLAGAVGNFDDMSEFFNQVAYTPGVVLAVLNTADAAEFLSRYLSPAIPEPERAHFLHTPAFTVTEMELDMSRGYPIVALKPIIGAEAVPNLRAGVGSGPGRSPQPTAPQAHAHPLVTRAAHLSPPEPPLPPRDSRRVSPVPGRMQHNTQRLGDGVRVFQDAGVQRPPPMPAAAAAAGGSGGDPRDGLLRQREEELRRREAQLGGRETALLLKAKGAPTTAERSSLRRPPSINFQGGAGGQRRL